MFSLFSIMYFSLFSQIHNTSCVRLVGNVRYHLKTPNNCAVMNWSDKFVHQNKKMISISPGGFKGFYMWGISTYIKEHYDVNDYIFSGASAGAWNALLMCYKGDPKIFVEKILEIETDFNKKETTLLQIENILKNKILNFTNENDYDLHKLFIGVSTFDKYHFIVNIFTDFDNLEDAIDCCISSSHIPFITGGFLKKYHNMYVFDGGFSKNPYMNLLKTDLHITPSLWQDKSKKKGITTITDYTTLFSKKKFNIRDLYNQGYDDSYKNKEVLDKIFLNKKL